MAVAAQTRIDEELSAYNLRTQRNTFPPISCLPTETLSTIFIHCASNSYFGSSNNGTVPSWVNVSYVCRRWRDVALNCPTLWTYLFINSQRWTEELLSRSKQAPLKLYIMMTILWGDAIVRGRHLVEQVMLNHVERIQELDLLLNTDVSSIMSMMLSPRAPRLQNLAITLTTARSEEWPVLFDGDTPALRTLKLKSCPLPWYSFTLSGLTTLSLENVPDRFQRDAVELLPMLGSMQGLRHLYLEDALPSASNFLFSPAFDAFQKINLPHLSRLLIDAPISAVITSLSCVNVPSTTEIRLGFSFEDGFLPDHSIALLCSALTEIMPEDWIASGRTIRSLVIQSRFRDAAVLTFSGMERHCNSFGFLGNPDWDCNIPLRITFDWGDDEETISNICCSIPLPHVQSMFFSHSPFSPAFWWTMLGHFRELRHIKFGHDVMADIAPILSLTADEDQGARHDQDGDHILVPRLDEIELYGITFPQEGDSGTTLQSLIDALTTRNVPQGRLSMVDCDIDGSKRFDMVWTWDDHVVSGGYPDFPEDGSDNERNDSRSSPSN